MIGELNSKFAFKLDANPSTKGIGLDADHSVFTIILVAGTLIKKKIMFSSYIRKFRMEQLQSHI